MAAVLLFWDTNMAAVTSCENTLLPIVDSLAFMPRVKPSSYNLRKETCFKPKINTMRFKNSFINRLVFKYELAM